MKKTIKLSFEIPVEIDENSAEAKSSINTLSKRYCREANINDLFVAAAEQAILDKLKREDNPSFSIGNVGVRIGGKYADVIKYPFSGAITDEINITAEIIDSKKREPILNQSHLDAINAVADSFINSKNK